MSVVAPVSYYPAAGYLSPRSRPRVLAGVLVGLAAIALPLLWRFFVNRARGQRVERWVLAGADASSGTFWDHAPSALSSVVVASGLVVTALAILIAVLRRRPVLAVQLAVAVGAANLTTQLLKEFLPRRSLLTGWTGPNSLPSGHTTLAASATVALVFATPRRWRPLAALAGALWTAAVGSSTIARQWHRPADVVAAVLVAFFWGALLCAVTSRRTLDVPATADDPMAAPGTSVVAGLLLAAGAILLAVGMVALQTLLRAGDTAPEHGHTTAYHGGMAGAVGVTLLLFGLLLLVRQATACPRRLVVTGYRSDALPQPALMPQGVVQPGIGQPVLVQPGVGIPASIPPEQGEWPSSQVSVSAATGMEYQWPAN